MRKAKEIRKDLKKSFRDLQDTQKDIRDLIEELRNTPRFSAWADANRHYIGSGSSDPLYHCGWIDGQKAHYNKTNS